MPLFEIDASSELVPFRRLRGGPEFYEREIEELLWRNLEEFTGESLFPVARRPTVQSGGIPDIVALNRSGDVVSSRSKAGCRPQPTRAMPRVRRLGSNHQLGPAVCDISGEGRRILHRLANFYEFSLPDRSDASSTPDSCSKGLSRQDRVSARIPD